MRTKVFIAISVRVTTDGPRSDSVFLTTVEFLLAPSNRSRSSGKKESRSILGGFFLLYTMFCVYNQGGCVCLVLLLFRKHRLLMMAL